MTKPVQVFRAALACVVLAPGAVLPPDGAAAAAGTPAPRQPHVVFLVAEEEYRTAETLPAFARDELAPLGVRSTFVVSDKDSPNRFAGLAALRDADLLLVSVRRRAPADADMAAIRAHLAAGKPLVGIRTASHAFAPKETVPPGHASWPGFALEVLGGRYDGHFGNRDGTDVRAASGAANHPILDGPRLAFHSRGTLYRYPELSPSAEVLVRGAAFDRGRPVDEPVAWTHRFGASRVFYTSLGHPADFAEPAFRRLLAGGVLWALGRGRAGSPLPGQADLRPGLVATLRDGRHRVRLVVATPNFHLGPREAVHPALAPASSGEWTGLLSVLQAGHYFLEAGPAEISIDGRRVPATGVGLGAGLTPIRVAFRRTHGPATVQLTWRSEHFGTEPVPSAALVHRADDAPAPGDRDRVLLRGRDLVEELGCTGCHATRSPSLARRTGPDLDGVGSRLDPRWVHAWLADPRAFRSSATMPVTLDAAGRADVAAYLATLVTPPGADDPSGAEAARENDLRPRAEAARENDLRPRAEAARGSGDVGREVYRSAGCAQCHHDPTLALRGLGSKYTAAALAAYLLDPARVHPGGRMPSLMLSGSEAAALAAWLGESRDPAFEAAVPPGDARRGRTLVASRCLGCHALSGARAAARPMVRRLEALAPERGCLADVVPPKAPVYRLRPEDRAALRAFVSSLGEMPDISPAPVFDLPRRAADLRCTACHTLDDRAPDLALAESVPSLTNAGARLRTDWIADVLGRGRRARDFLQIRMPHYDRAVSRPLAVLMAKASGTPPERDGAVGGGRGRSTPRSAGEADWQRGHGLLGTNPDRGGLGCIGCHGWGEHKALAESGPDLALAARRLRPDFYRRWMRDPARVVSGTSMPNYFAAAAPADAQRTIDTLWAALERGERLPVPEGYASTGSAAGGEALPQATTHAVVVRWDMPQSTPAAIAVGLPGKISFCFDAGESRLRYAWHGGFIDLSPTLLRKIDKATRLTPTAAIVGEVFYRSAAFPLRVGSPDRVPEHRFRGYRMIDGFPEFLYEVDGMEVRDRIALSAEPRGLRRRIEIAHAQGPMWLLDARFAGDRLEIPHGTPARLEVIVPIAAAPEKR